jgi:hypothetical protein
VTEDAPIVIADAPGRKRFEYVDLVPAGDRASFDL